MVYTVVVKNAPNVQYQFNTLSDVKKNALMIILTAEGKKWDKYLLVYDGKYSPKKQPVISIERNEMDACSGWPFNLLVNKLNAKGYVIDNSDLPPPKVSAKQLNRLWDLDNRLERDF